MLQNYFSVRGRNADLFAANSRERLFMDAYGVHGRVETNS